MYDPMKSVRKPIPKPDKIIHGPKYDKAKVQRESKRIIEEGIKEYKDYNETEKEEQ